MSSLLVLVPSRGRPDNIARLIARFRSTRSEDTRLLVAVDDDDETRDGYLQMDSGEDWLEFVVGPRLRLAGTLNDLAPKYADSYDVLGFMGDDHLPWVAGWDRRILEESGPGTVVYGNDLFQGANLPTAVFLDSGIVRALGYFVPTGMTHLFLDNAWQDWGTATGKLKYLPDVIIEHLHPAAGKSELDDRYTEVNSEAVWSADELRYNEYKTNGEFAADIRKLQEIS